MNISGGNPRTYPPGSRFPIKIVVMDREPTESDIFDFEVGTEWLARLPTRISWWKLSGKEGGKALWLRLGGTDETKLKLNVREDATPSATFTQVDADPTTGGIFLQGDNNVQVFKSANEDHSVDIAGSGSGGTGGIRAVEGDNMTRGDPDSAGLFHIDGDGTLTATSVHVAGEDTLTVKATEAVLSTLTGDGNTEAQARNNKIAITGENGLEVHAEQTGASGNPTLSIRTTGGGGNSLMLGVNDDDAAKVYAGSDGTVGLRGTGGVSVKKDTTHPHICNIGVDALGSLRKWELVNPGSMVNPATQANIRLGSWDDTRAHFTDYNYTLVNPADPSFHSSIQMFSLGRYRYIGMQIFFNINLPVGNPILNKEVSFTGFPFPLPTREYPRVDPSNVMWTGLISKPTGMLSKRSSFALEWTLTAGSSVPVMTNPEAIWFTPLNVPTRTRRFTSSLPDSALLFRDLFDMASGPVTSTRAEEVNFICNMVGYV